MVAGDSCDNPLEPEAGVELPQAAVLPERGLAGAWLKPVDGGDDDLDEVSEWRASSTDDAAPRASSMTDSDKCRAGAAFYLHGIRISKRRATAKKPIKPGFLVPQPVRWSRQLMPLRQNFPPLDAR